MMYFNGGFRQCQPKNVARYKFCNIFGFRTPVLLSGGIMQKSAEPFRARPKTKGELAEAG